MDIVVWLESLGLGRYEAAFRDNEIDETVLPSPFGRGRPGAGQLVGCGKRDFQEFDEEFSGQRPTPSRRLNHKMAPFRGTPDDGILARLGTVLFWASILNSN